jgi:hypothetical protein
MPHFTKIQRHIDTSGIFDFHGFYKTFRYCDAPVFAYRAESWTRSVFRTPIFIVFTIKLITFVGDYMLWFSAIWDYGFFKSVSDFFRRRLFFEKRETDSFSGKVVDNHKDPPAERPSLME